ncbi:Meiotically up-regulated protein 87 protein [Sphaceloma murrayae]|uniref:Meiotically up-regulated protein 87 protein n=1 Tax=Sphaceloma murrayae TaxID=2082308 RepID=A0A2K1R0K4_9PEZI|nr:Meiotically up-regulated protein 87 protein [Sphaceloma murrayae]
MAFFSSSSSGAQQSKPAFSFPTPAASGTASNATSAPQSTGLFGSTLGAQNTQSSGGLFGALGQKPATSGAASGTFGNLGGGQTSGATSGGLFGNLGGGQQQQTTSNPGSNIFGRSDNSSQQQSTGTTGFGTSTGQNTQGGGLFGNLGGTSQQNNAQTSQPAPSGGMFAGLGASQQQQTQQPPGGLFRRRVRRPPTTGYAFISTSGGSQTAPFPGGLVHGSFAGNSTGFDLFHQNQGTENAVHDESSQDVTGVQVANETLGDPTQAWENGNRTHSPTDQALRSDFVAPAPADQTWSFGQTPASPQQAPGPSPVAEQHTDGTENPGEDVQYDLSNSSSNICVDYERDTEANPSQIGQASATAGQQPQATTTAAAQQPQQQPQKTEPQLAYFGQLLERGKKRQLGDLQSIGQTELPSLQLGLGDISRKLRNLGQTEPNGTRSPRSRGPQSHYMLSASGVNTAAALRDLSSLNAEVAAKQTAAPATGLPSFDTDLEGYVEGMYKQSSLDLVEYHFNKVKKDFDDFLEEHVQMEWDTQRQRIYEHFGLAKKGDEDPAGFDAAASVGTRGAFGRSSRRSKLGASAAGPGASGMTKSVLGVPSMRGSRAPGFTDVAEKASTTNFQPAPEDRLLREKQDRYTDKVKSLNVARLEESAYPLLHAFAEVENQPSPDDTTHFVNCFKALAEITGENSTPIGQTEPDAVKERQFAKDYLDDSPTSEGAFQLRKRILNGSRMFLEKQFLSSVEAAVAKNPREANLGGVPTVTNKIRGFIRLRSARKELGADNVFLQQVGDDYAWVLVFYLLRAGLVDEANEYVQSQSPFFGKADRSFLSAIGMYAGSQDRRLFGTILETITKEYSSKLSNVVDGQIDPYRAACYKIVGRCGLNKRNLEGVNQGMEDWVWLQFALARESDRAQESATDFFGLDDVRTVFQEIGQRHFTQGQAEGAGSYGTYFFLQILAGQFESAIAWLYPHNYLTAVHFALALNYYGLLRVNDFNGSDDLLSYTTRQQPQLSFGHMLGYYTRDFRAASPAAAADYLCLIALNSDVPGDLGSRQLALCHEALREVVLETREFAQLLGDIRFDGQRIKGAIEARLPLIRITSESQFLRDITIGAAQIADETGRVTDAVLLYHLAEEYDDVVSVCARALSDAIAAEEGDVVARLEPLKPRATDSRPGVATPSDAAPPNSSLSVTAVTTPHELAASMLGLYKSNTLLLSKVRSNNHGQVELLLRISGAKQLFQQRKWVMCLDAIDTTGILPTSAGGDISRIRARAHAFDALPPLVSREASWREKDGVPSVGFRLRG